jgi:hypothetical protein
VNTNFIAQAVDNAVQTYTTISNLADPASAAAFGVACGVLQERLNCNLQTAADLLRGELDRRGIGRDKPTA